MQFSPGAGAALRVPERVSRSLRQSGSPPGRACLGGSRRRGSGCTSSRWRCSPTRRAACGAVGLVALIRVFPAAAIAPFAAVLSDRFRRERVMLFSDLTRAVALVCAALVVAFSLPAGIVYALAGVVTILSTTFRPAQSALLPTLSRSPEELTAANVVMSTIAAVGSFAGPALGGVLLATTSVEAVFSVTAATFLLSAFFVARIRAAAPPAGRVEREAERRTRAGGLCRLLDDPGRAEAPPADRALLRADCGRGSARRPHRRRLDPAAGPG